MSKRLPRGKPCTGPQASQQFMVTKTDDQPHGVLRLKEAEKPNHS